MKAEKKKQNHSLIPYRRDNKWGYCDKNFNIKIPIIYDEALTFSEGLAAVRVGELWGFINKSGKQIVDSKYQIVSDFFKNGNAIVYTKDFNNRLIINKKGRVIQSEKCHYALFENRKITRSELLNEGEMEAELLLSTSDFTTYYVYVNDKGKKEISELSTGYFNSSGNFIENKSIAKIQLKKNEDFTERFVPIKIGWQWNFIDKTYKLLFNDKIKYSDFLDESLFNYIVETNKNRKNNIDKLDGFWRDMLNGPETTLEQDGFDEARNFSEGLAGVKVIDKWGFINTKGKVVIKCKYDDITDSDYYVFKEGIAKIIDNSIQFYIDNTGKKYFEYLGDVLKRELSFTTADIISIDEQYPFFNQTLTFLENKKYKNLKTSLANSIEKNKILFNYNQKATSILGKLKKQTNSLTKLFQEFKITSDGWQKFIFSSVQSLVKKDNEYIDSEYMEYYEPENKEFFKKIESDFRLETLVNLMNRYYERNKLSEIFRLCMDIQKRRKVKISLKGLQCSEMVFNKFSIGNSIERINQLIKLLNDKGLINKVINNKNALKSIIEGMNINYKNNYDNLSYQFRSLARALIKQPKFFIQFISHNYPFNETELNKWQNYLDWRLISCNTNIRFNLRLITHFIKRWFWLELSQNKAITWDSKTIEACEFFLDRPDNILGNPIKNIRKSENAKKNTDLEAEIAEKLENELPSILENDLHLNEINTNESNNQKAKWNEDLIEKHKDKINWKEFSQNTIIDWTPKLILKYADKLDFEALSDNESINWTYELIAEFKDKIDWLRFCKMNKHWTEEIISKFNTYFCWDVLVDNKYFPWNLDLIKKFNSKMLDKNHLSKEMIFYGNAIPKDLNYLNYLNDTYSDFKLDYCLNDLSFIYYHEFEPAEQIIEINKIFKPILNNISVCIIMNLLIQAKMMPKFLNEKETEKLVSKNQLEEKRIKWEYNHMSKAELADFLGYDYDDISELDDITEDQIWERTGH
jgi:WG containing repeat